MRKIIATLICFVILTGCSSTSIKEEANQNIITMSIKQNDETVEIMDNTVQLRRAPFSFLFNFTQPDGLLVHASMDNSTYLKAESGKPLSELPGFKNTSISEELFNKESVLYLSDDAPSYWYYTDETDSRFNSVQHEETGFTCRRDIKSIIDVTTGKNKLVSGQMKGDTIYIVIIKADWNKDYTERIELNRKLLKIIFNI